MVEEVNWGRVVFRYPSDKRAKMETGYTEEGTEKLRLSSRQSEERIRKGQMPQEVAKENQQYRLCLQYQYIGSSEQEHKL